MFTLRVLTIASIKMFLRNKQALFFTLFMPIIIMTIFGLIGFDRPQTIAVGVVTTNPTESTKEFVGTLSDIDAFNVYEGSEEEERRALDDGERAVVLLVPDTLMPEEGRAPETQTITVLTNVEQQQQSQIAVSVLTQLLDKTTLAIAQAPQLFEIKTEEISSRNLRYIDFLLPGIVAMAVMQMAVFSVSFVFVDYKEKGILKRLLATPLKPYQFVGANVFTRLLVAVVQSAILIAVGVLLYKTQVIGSYWLILLITILGSIMFLGLGFAISGLAKTVEAVPAIANLVVFPMLFLGGTFFPIDSMPEWLQGIVKFMPLSYFSHSLREVMTNDAGVSAISGDLYAMLAWSVIMVVLAMITFRFEEKRV